MKKLIIPIGIVLALIAAYYTYNNLKKPGLPAGIASGNGRIEATEINLAVKTGGRIKDVLVREGDFVVAGQTIAQMDSEQLEAQKKQAEAQLKQAEIQIETANILVEQRKAEQEAAVAAVKQQESTLAAASKRFQRTKTLSETSNISLEEVDDHQATALGAAAAVSAAKAQVSVAAAAINSAKSQVINAQSAVEAAKATIERIQADINDCDIRAPRDGRIQYRIAEPGEVLASGSNVVNLVDLSDVYMTFFLSTEHAGRLAIGDDVRLILDAAPDYVVPAKISYVADVAQFTPKSVETEEERLKLMFRVKAQIPRELLKKHIQYVKTGVPGMAYVRVEENVEWPASLIPAVE